MPTRLNYTGRRKLTGSEVQIRIFPEPSGPASFDVSLDLKNLGTEIGDARIFIEAYHQSLRMRYDFGTVALPLPPPPELRRLSEFEDWRHVLFRVKVTDARASTRGRLLAWRNKIRPQGPKDDPEADLVRFSNADLDGLLWVLEFDDDGPVVKIDSRAGDRFDVGGDDKFISAIYPEVMRRSLVYAFVDQQENGDDEEHWSFNWLEGFLKPKLGIDNPPPLDEMDPHARVEWVDEAVRVFANRNKLSTLWSTQLPAEDLS